MKVIYQYLLLGGMLVLLSGCLGGGGGGGSQDAATPPAASPASSFYPLFDPDPANPRLPSPINLAFTGSTDGTLNIPGLPPSLSGLNDLDGWSTVAPLEVRFSEPLDPSSLAGQFRVIRTTLTSPATAAVLANAANTFAVNPFDPTAAIAVINNAVALGLHAPHSGHLVPLASFTCALPELNMAEDFEVSVSATEGGEQTVLLKPRRPLAGGEDLRCLQQGVDPNGQFFYHNVIAQSALDPSAFTNGYLVTVGNGLRDLQQQQVRAPDIYQLLQQPANQIPPALQDLHALYQEHFNVLDALGVSRQNLVLSFSFGTQGIAPALKHLAAGADFVATSLHFSPFEEQLQDQGREGYKVYQGLLQDLPYFLNNRPANLRASAGLTTAADGAASVLQGNWTTADGAAVTRLSLAEGLGPHANQRVDIPVLLVLPELPEVVRPADGWPVVIYAHGLSSNRGAALGLARRFAEQGWAILAIDHPLHGVTGAGTDATYIELMTPQERHFYLDLLNNSTGATGADGILDASGAHATPVNTATARDLRRQSVADLLHLLASLQQIEVNGEAVLDAQRVSYAGISFGSVIGSMLAAVSEDRIKAFSLNVPAGGMAKVYDGSPLFLGRARQGYANAGLFFGTKAYEDYLGLVQTIEDSGDPINYANLLANRPELPVQLMEMVGRFADGMLESPPDLVLPNDVVNSNTYRAVLEQMYDSAPLPLLPLLEPRGMQVAETAPLAGSTPLWRNMGLQPLTGGSAQPPVRRVVRFSGGSHFSLHLADRPAQLMALFVGTPPAVVDGAETLEAVQRQVVQFVTSEGATLSILPGESALIAP